MTGEHVVETLHWDVAFASEEEAFDWQPRLVSLLRGPAVTLINEVFDEAAARGEVLALDTLEIDLGRLPRDGLEIALQDRLRARLSEALQAQWAGARAQPSEQAAVQPREDKESLLLRHYLERGFLPWQAGEGVQRRLAALAEAAMREDAPQLAAWLRAAPTAASARLANLLHPRIALARARVEAALLAQSPLAPAVREAWTQLALCDAAALVELATRHGQVARVRRRMARDFGAGMLMQLVELIVPLERDFIAGVTSQAPLFAAAMQPPIPEAHMRPRLWEFTLAYLLVERGSEFNRRSYIASLLRRSAEQEGVDQAQLVQSLMHALAAPGAVAGALQRQMLELLRAIAQQEGLRAVRDARREAASREWIAQCDADVHGDAHLEHKRSVAAALRAETPIGDTARTAWMQLAEHDAGWLASEVARQGQSDRVRRRMARDFARPMLLRLVHVLVPMEHDFIAAVTAQPELFAQAALPPQPVPHVRTRLWEFTLAYLLVDRGSEFNRRSYMASLLRGWAESDGIDHAVLLQSLVASLRTAAAGAMQQQMLALLRELTGDHARTEPAQAAISVAAAPGSGRWRALALPQLRFAWQAALATGDWRSSGARQAWAELLHHDAAWLREETRRDAQAQGTRERLVAHAAAHEPGQLVQLAELFAPGESEFVETVIAQAAPLARRDAPAAARRRLWEFTLAFLTTDRGSEFNRRSYLAAMVARMARAEGVDYREMLQSLNASLRAAAPAGGMQRQLSQLTQSLLVECDARASGRPSSDRPSSEDEDWDATAEGQEQLRRLLDNGDRRVRAALESTLRSAQAADRLAARLPARLLTRIVFALRPREHDAIEKSARQLVAACIALRAATPARLQELQRQFMLRYLFVEGRRFSPGDFAQRFVTWLQQRLQIRDAAAWRASIARELKTTPRHASQRTSQAVGRAMAAALRLAPPLRERENTPMKKDERPVVEPQAGEPIYVANAGLVLAHPFLPHLFTLRGLTHEGKFRDPASAARAVVLTQFLVTGQGEFVEHEVVLNKIVCGLPVAEPLVWQGELDDDDRAAAKSLLAAMVQQWKGLGTTSPEGLRETFLRREGRLSRKGEDWMLLVQPGPYDMLIDTLPWGFSIVKFPWMERMVHVQWR